LHRKSWNYLSPTAAGGAKQKKEQSRAKALRREGWNRHNTMADGKTVRRFALLPAGRTEKTPKEQAHARRSRKGPPEGPALQFRD
jgi:hypothetical protein